MCDTPEAISCSHPSLPPTLHLYSPRLPQRLIIHRTRHTAINQLSVYLSVVTSWVWPGEAEHSVPPEAEPDVRVLCNGHGVGVQGSAEIGIYMRNVFNVA